MDVIQYKIIWILSSLISKLAFRHRYSKVFEHSSDSLQVKNTEAPWWVWKMKSFTWKHITIFIISGIRYCVIHFFPIFILLFFKVAISKKSPSIMIYSKTIVKGMVNTGIIGNSQWLLYAAQLESDWLFMTSSNVLKADWLSPDNNEWTALHVTLLAITLSRELGSADCPLHWVMLYLWSRSRW